MSERIKGSYDDALYKSTYTLLYGFPIHLATTCSLNKRTYYDFPRTSAMNIVSDESRLRNVLDCRVTEVYIG